MTIAITFATALFIVIGTLMWAARHHHKKPEHGPEWGLPNKDSYFGGLLGCSSCQQIVACHRYIEEHKMEPGWNRNFCPSSMFFLQLTGR